MSRNDHPQTEPFVPVVRVIVVASRRARIVLIVIERTAPQHLTRQPGG
jgi:hypothetical protein